MSAQTPVEVRLGEDQFQRLCARIERRIEKLLRPGQKREVRTAAGWAEIVKRDARTIRRWAADARNLDWTVTGNQGREQLIRGPKGLV